MPVVSISDSQRGPLPAGALRRDHPARSAEGSADQGAGHRRLPGVSRADLAGEKRRMRRSGSRPGSGMKIKMAAKIDKVDEAYYQSTVEPLLPQGDIEFIGEIGEHQKSEFLGNAAALVFSDRVAGTFRPGDDRGDGLRHAGDRVQQRFGARGPRGRRHRIHRRERAAGDRGRGKDRHAGRATGSAPNSTAASLHTTWPRIICGCTNVSRWRNAAERRCSGAGAGCGVARIRC